MTIKFTGEYVEWGNDKARRVFGPPHSPIWCPNKAIGTNDHVYAPTYLTDTKNVSLSRGYIYSHPVYIGYNGKSSISTGGNSSNTHWTWMGMGCRVQTAQTGSAIQMGLYSSFGFRPHELMGLVQVSSATTGLKEGTFSTGIDLPAGWYWVSVMARQGAGNPSILAMGYSGNATGSSFLTAGAHSAVGGGWYLGRYGHTVRWKNTLGTTPANTSGALPTEFYDSAFSATEDQCRSSLVSVMIGTSAP